MKRRSPLASVVILAAGAALGCGGGPATVIGFDEATGCCRMSCGNGCDYILAACPPDDANAGACCTEEPLPEDCPADSGDTGPQDTGADTGGDSRSSPA